MVSTSCIVYVVSYSFLSNAGKSDLVSSLARKVPKLFVKVPPRFEFEYVKLFGDGVSVTVKVPLNPTLSSAPVFVELVTFLTRTTSLTLNLCGKSEVTVTHQSTDDLREKLRAKLNKLVKVEDDRDKDPIIIDGESFDVDKELGLKDE